MESTLTQCLNLIEEFMGLEHLDAGKNVPDDFNVVIEISANSYPVKYEIDKACGLITVDRFLGTSMTYPCNYGYVPQTLSEDGDPVDVLAITPYPLVNKSVIRCRAIGMLCMTDESGKDAKILAVPITKLSPHYQHVKTPKDLGEDMLDTIAHFFTHYKDLEKGKWVKVNGWKDAQAAKDEIVASVKRYQPMKVE